MTGCPSRQQLFNVVAERASQIESAAIGVHTRSCPDCRDLLAELSKAGALISDRSSVDNGETVMQTLPASSVTPNGAADSGQTFDGTAFGASLSAAAALADAPHASENMHSQQTERRHARYRPVSCCSQSRQAKRSQARRRRSMIRAGVPVRSMTRSPLRRRPPLDVRPPARLPVTTPRLIALLPTQTPPSTTETDAGQTETGSERTLPDAAPVVGVAGARMSRPNTRFLENWAAGAWVLFTRPGIAG